MSLKTMPFALPDLYTDHIHKDPADSRHEFWLIFKDSKLLIDKDSMQPFQARDLLLKRSLYMGTYSDFHIHIGEASFSIPPSGAIFKDLKALFGKMDEAFFSLAGRAVQLISWDRTHQFCGQCGNKTSDRQNERAKECLSCKLLFFPRISPVIMALVQKEDEILLARGVNFPMGFYSALAGFVDPGETLEQCVKREVFEEVGLRVDDIRYFSSQSWPFPNSLMIAFTCQWKSGEIRIDPSEIIDARWFKRDNLPLLPPEFSISRVLIDAALGGKI